MKSRLMIMCTALASAAILAACGSSYQAASSGGSSSSGGSGGSGDGALGIRSIKNAGTVLTTSEGMTLYMRTTDRNGKITCTGKCASNWPPLIGSGPLPKLPSGASGQIAALKRPDGGQKQVTFAGHPLYTFVHDSAPGQANGQGLDDVWFAMKANGSSKKSGGSGKGSNGGGYGY